MSDKLPAYETIKRHVLARIHDGTWKEGDAIPGEEALAREFGVSRMTVAKLAKKSAASEPVLAPVAVKKSATPALGSARTR